MLRLVEVALAWISVGCLMAGLRSQGPDWGRERLIASPQEMRIASSRAPLLVVIPGSRGPKDGDVRMVLDGIDQGLLSDHGIAPGTFVATVPLWPAPKQQQRTIRFVPIRGGLVVGPISTIAAAVLRIELGDALGDRSASNPAVVRITSVDGRTLPSFTPGPSKNLVGAACLCPDGSGELLIPADRSVSVATLATSFRPLVRRRLIARAGSQIPLRIDLPPSILPTRAAIQTPPPPHLSGGISRQGVRRSYGIARVWKGFSRIPSGEVEQRPRAFLHRLEERGRPPLILDPWSREMLPRSPRPLVSVALPGGGFLHSNGPVLELGPIVRSQRDPSRVLSSLIVRRHSQIGGSDLEIRQKGRPLVRRRLPAGESKPIPLSLKRGELLTVYLHGEGFEGDGILAPVPLAFLRILLP